VCSLWRIFRASVDHQRITRQHVKNENRGEVLPRWLVRLLIGRNVFHPLRGPGSWARWSSLRVACAHSQIMPSSLKWMMRVERMRSCNVHARVESGPGIALPDDIVGIRVHPATAAACSWLTLDVRLAYSVPFPDRTVRLTFETRGTACPPKYLTSSAFIHSDLGPRNPTSPHGEEDAATVRHALR